MCENILCIKASREIRNSFEMHSHAAMTGVFIASSNPQIRIHEDLYELETPFVLICLSLMPESMDEAICVFGRS